MRGRCAPSVAGVLSNAPRPAGSSRVSAHRSCGCRPARRSSAPARADRGSRAPALGPRPLIGGVRTADEKGQTPCEANTRPFTRSVSPLANGPLGPQCARGAAKKPTTARTTHATATGFTHSHAEPATSWLTITATTETHTAATRNNIARALVLTFLLPWAVGGVCVGADPASARALITVNSASVRAPDLRAPSNFAVSTASLIAPTA